ncbi:MAG: kinetochore component CENP-S-domain-containing protein [Piptocephalis tieghemiana]|nr:MAG: kinetochore component CENP-S-domain-containing protein [Piptocephalis tieghemiana]
MSSLDPEEQAFFQQRLKASVWYVVGKICEEEGHRLQVQPTRAFVASLTELVYQQAETMGDDLEYFARHGKRTTISMEDVKLCTRRNESLYQQIKEDIERLSQAKREKRQKRE